MQDTLKIDYSLIFENMTAALCVVEVQVDESGRPVDFIIAEVNSKFEKIFRMNKSNMLGKSVFLICPDGDSECWQALREVYSNGGSKQLEVFREDLNGYFVVKVFKPEENHIAVLITDISERKKAEIKVKNSEQAFKNLYENVAGCVVIVDDNYIIRDVNWRTCEVTGFAKEELVGHLCDKICPKGMSSRKCPIWEEDQDGFIGMDTNVKSKDGSHVPIIKDARRLRINGQQCIFENFQDLSKQKKIEEELKEAKEKAEESSRLKTAFLANVSHEIRTPMNGILGFADLLKEPHLNGETQRQYLDVIERSGKRMLSIINDLVDISKIEANQIEVNIENIRVKDILNEQYSFFKPIAGSKGLGLDCIEVDDIEIETDGVRLSQVLANLLNNAIKYTTKGRVEFGCKLKNDCCEFFIFDTGVGIIKDLQLKIFDRFVQGDLDMTRKHEGVGLGLSISKAFVEKLGGEIWLKSSPGEGSRFYFSLPLRQRE